MSATAEPRSVPDASENLPYGLRNRVLDRLGLSVPRAPTLESLRVVYRAWCQGVPFDNVRKMIALRTGPSCPLPGGRASEFFEDWFRDGSGGTCWPTSNALFALVSSLGFEARRVAGSMRDLGVVSHASVKVRIDGEDWLVDSSLLTNAPLPLDRGVFVSDDPVVPAEVEPAGTTHVIWADLPPNPSYLPCRLLIDRMTHAEHLAAYEVSRARSPFNQRLYARRNRPGELVVLVGNTRFARTTGGLESRVLSPDDICRALRSDVGLSEALIEAWRAAGGCDASLEPPSGPAPPPVIGRPPSRR